MAKGKWPDNVRLEMMRRLADIGARLQLIASIEKRLSTIVETLTVNVDALTAAAHLLCPSPKTMTLP